MIFHGSDFGENNNHYFYKKGTILRNCLAFAHYTSIVNDKCC